MENSGGYSRLASEDKREDLRNNSKNGAISADKPYQPSYQEYGNQTKGYKTEQETSGCEECWFNYGICCPCSCCCFLCCGCCMKSCCGVDPMMVSMRVGLHKMSEGLKEATKKAQEQQQQRNRI